MNLLLRSSDADMADLVDLTHDLDEDLEDDMGQDGATGRLEDDLEDDVGEDDTGEDEVSPSGLKPDILVYCTSTAYLATVHAFMPSCHPSWHETS